MSVHNLLLKDFGDWANGITKKNPVAKLQSRLPLSATICINRRHWLERQLIKEKIAYMKDGNCFSYIRDLKRAQELFDEHPGSIG